MDTKFKTKIGYCHIIDGNIVLSKKETVEDVSKLKAPYSKIQSMVIVVALIGVMIYFFYDAASKKDQGGMVFSGVLAFFSILLSYNVFTNSAQPVITSDKIKTLRYRPGMNGFTRARFELTFEDGKGKLKKTLIVLPGTLGGGKEIAPEAHRIMKKAFPKFLK